MAHKLEPYKEQILDLKAAGDSVREIARKLSESSGERIAPSTVQYACKMWSNENGESKNDSEIDTGAVQGRVDSPEVLAGEPQARVEQHEFGALPLRPARHRDSRKPLKLVLAGVIAAALSTGYLWQRTSVRKDSIPRTDPVQTVTLTPKKSGIRVEIFKSGEFWQAVKWPEDMPSPLLRAGDEYLLRVDGLNFEYKVDESTSHVENHQPVPGIAIANLDEVNDTLNAVCRAHEGLRAGGLYEFVHDPKTWDKVGTAREGAITQ